MKKELIAYALYLVIKWILIKIPLAILSAIYSLISLVVLLLLAPVLVPLEKAGKEPTWLYDVNDSIKDWFNAKLKP